MTVIETRSERGDLSIATRRAVLVAAVLGTALAYMSDDMLNLAIPWVARELEATVTDAQWILNAYYVSLVSCVLVAGSIGDIVGHRRVFTWGIVLFSVGAVACALAPAMGLLVVGRFVQGVGAAMLLTAGLALIARLNPPQNRTRAVGQFFGLVAAVPALGPFLSGALIGWFSWRWLFVIPLALPAVALMITHRGIPETPLATDRRIDISGALLLFFTLGAFSVALIVGAEDLIAPLPLIGLAFAALAGTWFVRLRRHAADPLLPRRLLGRRPFLGGNLIWMLACITSWGAVFFVAVMLQTTLGLTPMTAGLLLTPIYLVMMIGSPLVGKLANRIGPRLPIVSGLLVYACGLLLLSRVGPTSTVVPDVVFGILVMAVGMATFTAPLAEATMGALEESDQGVASAFNNIMGQLAGLLAVVLLPAAAGLAGVAFTDPTFSLGYSRALLVVSVLAGACTPLAVWTFRDRQAGEAGKVRRLSNPSTKI